MSKRDLNEIDLSAQEQENVRNVLFFLRTRLDAWKPLGKLLHFEPATVVDIATGRRNVSPTTAFRVARFLKIPIDDLLSGKWPPTGMCPKCGHVDRRTTTKRAAQ